MKEYYLFKDYVTPWDVKQYVYCPMIPWIIHHLGVSEPATESMEEGSVGVEYKEEIAKKLGLPRPWRFEVELIDDELGVRGKIDIIAGSRSLVIVEVKRYYRRRVEHFQAQLLVYALLANRLIGPVRKALLVVGDKVRELIVDKDLLAYAYKLVEKTWNSILDEKPPIVNQVSGKCATCWYRRYCLRVLLD